MGEYDHLHVGSAVSTNEVDNISDASFESARLEI